jgi:ligand-binding sensor domain-containing protein
MMLATVLFCLVLCAAPMLAQVAQPIKLPTAHARFERINTANGLSNNEITYIFQDRDGFMWFGTEDGLNRYDGYSFKVFKHNPKQPNSLRPLKRTPSTWMFPPKILLKF